MRTNTWILMAMAALLLLAATAASWAQDATFDINWDNQTMTAALQQLQRAFNVQYNLPGDLASKTVTIHRRGVTVAQAMQALATAAGVRVIADPNGVYVFQMAASPSPYGGAPGVPTPATPTNPWAVGGGGAAAPPMPIRPGQSTVQTGGGAYGATPGAAGTLGASGYTSQVAGVNGEPINRSDLIFRILNVTSIGPELIAYLYGGSAVYDQTVGGGQTGGGTSGGGGYGGQGGRTGGGGSTGSTGRSSGSTGSTGRGY